MFFLNFISTGKMLNDEQTLSEYKIDEKGFVVVMVTKVKRFCDYMLQILLHVPCVL